MKAILAVFLLSATTAWSYTPLPPAKPILTPAELQAAAQEIPVGRTDLVLPNKKEDAENLLSERFFNQPEEHRYSGVTNEAWEGKWLLFSNALVEKAKQAGLNDHSLSSCLKSLNRGRNRQTMLWPIPEQHNFPFGTSDEEIAAFEKQAEVKYQLALKDRDENPEQYYDNNLAIIPVAAYQAKHSGGECWIIVCKWEMVSKEKEYESLGHIMVWAMDTKTSAVLGYVSCD